MKKIIRRALRLLAATPCALAAAMRAIIGGAQTFTEEISGSNQEESAHKVHKQ